THASLRPFGAARTVADLARHDQWTHKALCEIGVGWNPGHRHTDKQFGQKAFHPLTSGMLWSRRAHGGPTHRPQLLLDGVVVSSTKSLLAVGRHEGAHAFLGPGDGLLIKRFALLSPLVPVLIVGKIVFPLVDIS